jgi:hypothetical protein
MKKLQMSIAGFALVLAFVAASAFKSSRVSDFEWTYNSGIPTEPSSYSLGSPSDCPGALTKVCFILAPKNGTVPVISPTLANEINTDLAIPRQNSANVTLRN